MPQMLMTPATMAEIRIAELTAMNGDVQQAIEDARMIVNRLAESDERFLRIAATTTLVQSLLMRGTPTDIQEAAAEIERLAAIPTDPGFVVNAIHLLRMRALLAKANGDETSYRDFADRYRHMANALGFEGHMALAEAMV
jgi:adenylate cyclase